MEIKNATAPQAASAPPKTVYTPEQVAEANANSTLNNVQKGADLTQTFPVFAQYEARFQSLANAVLNKDGKTSDDDQAKALVELRGMGARGQLFGMGSQSDNAKLYAQASGSSAAKRFDQLAKGWDVAIARSSDDAVGNIKATLAYYDSLSAADQKAFFDASVDPQLANGKKYADVADWREQMTAMVAFGEYMSAAKASGATTDPARSHDPKLQQAIKISNSRAQGRAWIDMVLQLFKPAPKDQVDLSPAAKALMPDAPASTGPRREPYVEGSIFKGTV